MGDPGWTRGGQNPRWRRMGARPSRRRAPPDQGAGKARRLGCGNLGSGAGRDDFWGQWHHGMFTPRPPPEMGGHEKTPDLAEWGHGNDLFRA